MSELDRLGFLVGRWKGSSKDQFGEQGLLESFGECTRELGNRFLQIKGETRKDGVAINKSLDFITYDSTIKKYVRKRLWSYGFIENGEGSWEDDNRIIFQITFNNAPPGFEGTLWRSFIRKYSDNEIGMGLLTSSKGEEYKLYGESRAFRTNR